ncbi:MAG: LemA family protein [Synergistaceae bacterium]|nr:LemA family protein [Synergistaceae bacterium]
MSSTAVSVTAAVILIAVFLWAISVYNGLVRLSNLKEEAWSGMDVPLRRRFDLVPNLVETVKSCAPHERTAFQMFQMTAEARGAVSAAPTRDARIEAEKALTDMLRNLCAAAAAYPDLKTNTDFVELQRELSSLENEIQLAGRYYNSTVSDFNAAILAFPAALISGRLGYAKAAMFGADDEPLVKEPVAAV